jgi:MOSC domain-containing protein YiiM
MVNNARDELAADAGVLRFLIERNATNLGVYADVVETGTVRVGDPVRVSLPDA